MEAARQRSLVDRMKGAAFLEVETYEEVEHDQTATGQAALVVGIVALASAIGSLGAGGGVLGFVGGIVIAFAGWLVWSAITYLVGTSLFAGTATVGELLRTLGFAQAPGVLSIFGIIPFLGFLVQVALFFWILVAGIVAIRQALDFSTGKAILTALIGWVAYMVIAFVVALIFGLPMAAMSA